MTFFFSQKFILRKILNHSFAKFSYKLFWRHISFVFLAFSTLLILKSLYKKFYKHLTSWKFLWLKYLNSYPIRKVNKPTCTSSQWKRRRTDEIEKSLRWTSNRFVTRRNKNEPLIKYYIIPKVCVRNKKKKTIIVIKRKSNNWTRDSTRHKNWCMARVLGFLIGYFSNYYTLHRSDLAARAAPLDPRLQYISIFQRHRDR